MFKRLIHAPHDEEHKGVKPIIEGYLLKKSNSTSEFKTRYFSLFPDANLVYYQKRGGQMKGVMKLTEDFYVSDHLLHPFGFQISDLSEIFYLAAADEDSKMFWMHTIAGVLRRLAKAGAEALPPQYMEVLMTKVHQVDPHATEQQPHDAVAEGSSRVAIYHDQTPPLPPPRPLKPPPATADADVVLLRHQLSDAMTDMEELHRTVEALSGEREEERRRADVLQSEKDQLHRDLLAAQSQLRESKARASSLEAQLAALHQTEDEEKRKEVMRVQKAVEAEWSAKLEEGKRKAAAEVDTLKAENTALSREKAALSREVEDLGKQLSLATVAVPAAPLSARTLPPPPAPPKTPKTVVVAAPVVVAPPEVHHHAEAKANTPPAPPPPRPPVAKAPTTTTMSTSSTLPQTVLPTDTLRTTTTTTTVTNGSDEGEDTVVAGGEGKVAKSLVAHWASKAAAADASSKTNPFSKSFDPATTKGVIHKGAEGYGRPPPGSKTEERAIRAQEWVDAEIDKLVGVIGTIGGKDSQGHLFVKFGDLFLAYQDISDTLVGIMMRAKKRHRINYAGDMLWSGINDEVVITVL